MKAVGMTVLLFLLGSLLNSICHVTVLIPKALAQTGQPTNNAITVGEDRVVSVGAADLPIVEPHLAINPKDSSNLLAAAMVITKPDVSSIDCATFTSFDGGRTWKRQDFGLRNSADVWVAFLPDGTAVLGTLEIMANGEEQFLIYRSTDGGRTWSSKPVMLGRGHDHPTLVVDSASKQFGGSLYAISGRSGKSKDGKSRNTVFVARSTDGGASFQEPVQVIASNLSYEANTAAVLSDGTLLVSFADHHRRTGNRRRLERERDWLLTSSDGGKTFSDPLFISESCSGSGGWSSLAVSPSDSAFRERIYHLCASPQFGGIQVRFSDDRGEKWSDAVRPDKPGNVEPYARTPAIAVNKDGVVGVAWYDGRNDPSTIKGTFRCQEIYFTASLNGGETFLPETKVSSQRTCPGSPQDLQTAMRFPAGGEYMGMVTSPDGAFHLLWADNRTGMYQLRLATIKVNAKTENRQ